MEALLAALSREVVLIQGPPGTGKVNSTKRGGNPSFFAWSIVLGMNKEETTAYRLIRKKGECTRAGEKIYLGIHFCLAQKNKYQRAVFDRNPLVILFLN